LLASMSGANAPEHAKLDVDGDGQFQVQFT
jgi:hypothetical protein